MGTLERFSRVHPVGPSPSREEFVEMQRRVESALKFKDQSWSGAFILDGTIDLTTGQENSVKHGLGRVAQGFLVVDKTANADVWRGSTETLPTTDYLDLRCSANVTIKLMVW